MVWKAGKLQSHKNGRALFDVELYLTHEILLIVVARFTTAIPTGRLLHYTKHDTMTSITVTVHKLT
jgi:hypothetical protein